MHASAAFASNRLTDGERRSPRGRQNANYFDRSTFSGCIWRISYGARNRLLRWRRAGADFADRDHPVAIASDLSDKTKGNWQESARRTCRRGSCLFRAQLFLPPDDRGKQISDVCYIFSSMLKSLATLAVLLAVLQATSPLPGQTSTRFGNGRAKANGNSQSNKDTPAPRVPVVDPSQSPENAEDTGQVSAKETRHSVSLTSIPSLTINDKKKTFLGSLCTGG